MILNAQSIKRLATVHPTLREVIEYAASTAPEGIDFQVVQGNRTGAEQDALYAQGRTKPGKIVTWTRNSNHEGGRAIDFQAIVNGKPTWDEKPFRPIAQHIKAMAERLGVPIQWGVDLWGKDFGHIQLPKGVDVPDIKAQQKLVENSPSNSAKLIQERLSVHGYDIVADGLWGKKTQAAFDDFQKRHKLKPTMGKLDDATWQALKAESNPFRAVRFYRERGLSKIAATAMVGGFQQESWKQLDPTAVGDKGTAFGVSQVRQSRKMGLDLLAKQRGTDWTDLDTQLQYSWNELLNTEKRTLKLLQAATTMEQAAKAAISFFRPAGFTWEHPEKGHGYANRLANAIKLYNSTPNDIVTKS